MAIQNNDTSYLDIEAKIVALLELILKELNTLLRSVAKRAGALSNQTATNRQTTRPAYGGLRTYEASTTVGDLMCINPYDREHIVNLIIKCQKRLSAAEKLIERAERDSELREEIEALKESIQLCLHATNESTYQRQCSERKLVEMLCNHLEYVQADGW